MSAAAVLTVALLLLLAVPLMALGLHVKDAAVYRIEVWQWRRRMDRQSKAVR